MLLALTLNFLEAEVEPPGTDVMMLDKPPSSWPRWLKRIGWGLLMLVIAVAVRQSWHSFRSADKADQLQMMLAELDRTEPSWRLAEIEAAREEIPEEENSARIIVTAAGLLPKEWPSSDFDERTRLLSPAEKLKDEDFELLTKGLATVRPALEMARKLADLPRGRHRIVYDRNPLATLLPDQLESRRMVKLLVYEAMRQNQQGETKEALISCRAALNAARSLGDEPIAISQLIRIAGVLLACHAIERTLAQGEPPPEDLAELQKLLENEDDVPSFLLAMRGERASLHATLEAVEQGYVSWDQLSGSQPNWAEEAFLKIWPMDPREDHALALSLMARRIEEVQRPSQEQAALEKQFEQDIRNLPNNATFTRTLMPAMVKLGEAFRRKHASLRCTIAALAAERYQQKHKRWPDSLDKLCPQFLPAVPLDPFDGAPLRYRRFDEGMIIYCVGNDGVDNGGHLDPERVNQPGVDMGIRLWDVPKRRQPPSNRKQPKP